MPNRVFDKLVHIDVPAGAAALPIDAIVIVGDKFSPSMFNHLALFDGEVDAGSQLIVGPLVRCTYQERRYSFSVTPNRVDLCAHKSVSVMPQALIKAAAMVAKSVDNVRSAVLVNGVGLNRDTALPAPNVDAPSHHAGHAFCLGLIQDDALSRIAKTEPSSIRPSVSLRWKLGTIVYSVRIEPDDASDEEKVLVAVNGHQDLTPEQTVAGALTRAYAFKSHVEAIHARL